MKVLKRILLGLVAVVVALVVLAVGVLMWFNIPQNAAGMAAETVCAATFVAGREPDAQQIKSMYNHGDGCTKLWKGKGCPKCHESGLAGRVGLYELMVPDEPLVDAICADSEPAVIREILRKSGFLTLWDDGMLKVRAGHTTLEEVFDACRR